MKNVQEMKGLCEAYAFSQKSEPIICVCRKIVLPLHPQSTTGFPTDANGVHPVGKA